MEKIRELFRSLIGSFSWTAPNWLRYKTRIFVILLCVLAAYGVYYWYKHRPLPEYITAQITAPNITPLANDLIPDNLKIDFGIKYQDSFTPRSVAPLQNIGKEVTAGIEMTPTTKGNWYWDTESRLIFYPKNDWPAGQEYKINFNEKLFAQKINLKSWKYTFSTKPFAATISEFKFYQDPLNPKLRQAVATITFNFPVDPNSIEKNIALHWQNSDEKFKFTVAFDENKRKVFIKSEIIPLPEQERFLQLTILKGIQSGTHSATTSESLEDTLLIPDASAYFKISNVDTLIVQNPQDQPEQILNISTSLSVIQDKLNAAIHAYVLPQDYPTTKSEEAKLNYEWKDPGEVTPALLASATPLTLTPIPSVDPSMHSYKYKVSKPSYLFVTIDKGLRSDEFELTNTYATVLKSPAFPLQINFLHKGALLTLGTEEKLSVLVRGLPAVKFNIARVLPEDLNHLITQTAGDFSNPYFINYNFDENNISQISSSIQMFDASDPAKQQYTALDMKQYLSPQANGFGLFLIRANGWDPVHKYEIEPKVSRLILITDLGLIVKDNANSTHDVFVQSISSGLPVANATVSILGKNGLPLFTKQTDVIGRVTFPALTDYTKDQEPTVYLAKNNNDYSFIPYNRYDRQLQYSRFDVGGVSHDYQNTSALNGYVFTERGIYRPEDTIHIGMVVKQSFVKAVPSNIPLELIIIDPRGITVKKEKINLSEMGLMTSEFKTSALTPTGTYQINLHIVKDNQPSNVVGSTTVEVAEFLPDRLRIKAEFSEKQKGWVNPQDLKALVNLQNLYGTPATNRRITGRIVLSPQSVTFKEFPNYVFIDPLRDSKTIKTVSETLGDVKTNTSGEAEFDLNLDQYEKATYNLAFFAEGFEADGGRGVATEKDILVSPLQFFVGYKADSNLNFVKQKSSRQINFIAIDNNLAQQKAENLTIKLFKQQNVTSLVKKEDGTYQYQSVQQQKELQSTPLVIESSGTAFALNTQELGDYVVKIFNTNGDVLSRLNYSVVGEGQQSLPKNAELNVKLNKKVFNAGEDIELQITAPYTGAGLITIERDNVYAVQWFKTTSTSSVQKIKIPSDFQGNGYVNIAFVRDINSSEIYMSPLSYSVLPFTVNHQAETVNIKLDTPSLVKPGDSLVIDYQTDKPAQIILFAVDEGILQVSGFSTPNPLNYFFQKQALEVSTSQIVDQILPVFIAARELSSVGGDGNAAALLKANLNPFKRKTQEPVVYWSGILNADNTSREVVYTVPDYFNGALKIMAVAVALDAVGAAEKTVEVRGDFIVNPNVPTFVAPNDEFVVTASVANNLKTDATVEVALQVDKHLQLQNESSQVLSLKAGEEKPVQFKVRATDSLGASNLLFLVKNANNLTKMTASLSVRPAIPYSTSITSGHATTTTTVTLDRNLYAEFRKVEMASSTSPVILVTGLQQYLDNYPYGCVEQLVSKALPWLMFAKQNWLITDVQNVNEKIQKTIEMLAQRQMSNGAFNYWPDVGTNYADNFASVYAMHFLTEAKDNGIFVPRDMMSNGIGFLKDLAARSVSTLDEARLQAYAIYVLTRNEIVTTNYLDHLQTAFVLMKGWQSDITNSYLAATYQLLQNSDEGQKRIRLYKSPPVSAPYEDFYNRDIANAQYLFLISKHFPELLDQKGNELISSLVAAMNNETITTLLSGYTSLAFSVYADHANTNAKMQSIFAIDAEKKLSLLSASSDMYQRVSVPALAHAIQITEVNTGYFYQLTQAGFDKNFPKQMQNGVEVYREYHDANDKVVDNVKLGDEISVHIRVRATDEQYHTNISIVDLLPGGFEVVIPSVQRQSMDYVDAREDRVVFFGMIGPNVTELVYRVKATNVGKYLRPPILATAMYNPNIRAIGLAGKMEVN